MSAATKWTGADALDAIDRCDGSIRDAARLLSITPDALRVLERQGRAAKIAALREDAEADVTPAPTPEPTPPPPQPPQAPDEDAMTAQPIKIESEEQAAPAWSEWMARGQLMRHLNLSTASAQVAIQRGETADGRLVETRAVTDEDRQRGGVPPNARSLYRATRFSSTGRCDVEAWRREAAQADARCEQIIKDSTERRAQIRRDRDETLAVLDREVPADLHAEQAAQLRRDRDECLAALDAQREEATATIARLELEHERERASLLEGARRAEAERDEERAKVDELARDVQLQRGDISSLKAQVSEEIERRKKAVTAVANVCDKHTKEAVARTKADERVTVLERELERERGAIATLREQEATEAAMTREAITALERERDEAIEARDKMRAAWEGLNERCQELARERDAAIVERDEIHEAYDRLADTHERVEQELIGDLQLAAHERDEARAAQAEAEAQLSAVTAQRDEALARVSASSISHMPIELVRVMNAAAELIGVDEVLGVDLRVCVERSWGEGKIRIKEGA